MQRIGVILAPNFRVASLAALAVFEIAHAKWQPLATSWLSFRKGGAPVP
jgi:hypothetical protein